MKRYNIIISGEVQFVGFRYFVQQKSLEFNLTGWVRNLSDGTVGLEVQGDDKTIINFLKVLREGNGFCQVNDITPKIIENKPFEKSFRILL